MSSFIMHWALPIGSLVIESFEMIDAVSRGLQQPPGLKASNDTATGNSTRSEHHPAMVIFGGLFLGVPIAIFIMLLLIIRCFYSCCYLIRGSEKNYTVSSVENTTRNSDPDGIVLESDGL